MPRDSGDLGDHHTGGRRLAAVWFADIVGFTGLASRDEDAAMKLVELFQAVTRRAVGERGGKLIKFLGDGGLAVFQSADAAVRAGLAVQRDFGTRAAEAGTAARLRIGIHVGEVVSGPDGDVYGDGVNTAARIQREASLGQVVISEDVRRQIRQRAAFRLEPLGERSLRGLDEPVRLCVVVGGARRKSTHPLPCHVRAGFPSPSLLRPPLGSSRPVGSAGGRWPIVGRGAIRRDPRRRPRTNPRSRSSPSPT